MDKVVSVTVSMKMSEIAAIQSFVTIEHNFSETVRWLIRRGIVELKTEEYNKEEVFKKEKEKNERKKK